MSKHLSSQQVLEWVAGEGSVEVAGHLRECAECTARVEELAGPLGMFRSSARETAEMFAERQTVFAMPKRRFQWQWAAVAAALAVLAGIPVYRSAEQRHRAVLAQQDQQLMEQVDAALSEGVAGPMQPLEKMVSWTASSKQDSEMRQN